MALASQLFLSHSHADLLWKNIVVKHISPWNIRVWSDSEIIPGMLWEREIETTLESCSAALVLLTANYFGGGFIVQKELPMILRRIQKGNMRLLCLHVGASAFETAGLHLYQSLNDPAQPLNTLAQGQLDVQLKRISRVIASLMDANYTLTSPPLSDSSATGCGNVATSPRTDVQSDILKCKEVMISTKSGSRDVRIAAKVIKAGIFKVSPE